MRVVQINTFSNKATGSIMKGIHHQLKLNGHESYMIWGRGKSGNSDAEISIEDKIGVKLHGIYTRITDKTGFASNNETRHLLVDLDKIRPHIVHLHNIHGYYLNIELLFAYLKKNNIKVVWTLHDCWPITGHCAYFSMIGCEKWKTGCYSCPQKKTYPSSYLIDNSKWNWNKKKEVFSNVDIHIVTVSEWLRSIVLQSYLGTYPIRTIYNGINLTTFRHVDSNIKCELGIGNKFMILGVASEWTERKGLDDFVSLSKSISEEYYIVLVGLSKRQIKQLSNYRNIIALERTDSIEELVELYSAADVFVNASMEETMGMTTIEAMTCGTPAVVYNVTALPEIMSECSDNIVEPHDVKGLMTLINKICHSEKCSNRFRLATMKYDENERYLDYLKLYKEICL